MYCIIIRKCGNHTQPKYHAAESFCTSLLFRHIQIINEYNVDCSRCPLLIIHRTEQFNSFIAFCTVAGVTMSLRKWSNHPILVEITSTQPTKHMLPIQTCIHKINVTHYDPKTDSTIHSAVLHVLSNRRPPTATPQSAVVPRRL